MSVRNALVLFLALSTLSLLVACSSNSTAPAQPPPNGSFSNSNLSGTYVFSVSGTDANSVPFAIVGTFTANGKGGSGGITLAISNAHPTQVTSKRRESRGSTKLQ